MRRNDSATGEWLHDLACFILTLALFLVAAAFLAGCGEQCQGDAEQIARCTITAGW
jgi:hypothetical protein